MSNGFKSLTQLYTEVYNPNYKSGEVVYALRSGNMTAMLDYVAKDREGLIRIAEYFVKERILADKILDIDTSSKYMIIVKYDKFGDGTDIGVVKLYIEEIPVIR